VDSFWTRSWFLSSSPPIGFGMQEKDSETKFF
jgi:hypothetical protein